MSDLATPLIKEVQEFIKQLFLSGQSELQSREHEANEKEAQRENESVINRFKLNVQTNAVCVDILVWATKDEQGTYDIILQVGNSQ